jgi:hypothetical protein
MPSLELTHWLMVAGTLLVVAALLVSESEGRRRTKLIHLPTSRLSPRKQMPPLPSLLDSRPKNNA